MKKPTLLPHKLVLEVFSHLSTRNLCRYMILSRYFDQGIKEIIVERFHKAFSNQNKRLLVFISRHDLLELEQTRYAFDFAFESLNNKTLTSIFSVDSTQPKGTIGPNGSKLEGLRLCHGGVWHQRLINDSIQYFCWGINSEEQEARIYIYDTKTNQPYSKASFVTNGRLLTPVGPDICESTKGWWSAPLLPKNKKRAPMVKFTGRNKISENVHGASNLTGKFKSISIKASLLLVSLEEPKFDKSDNGVKYLLMEGGEEYFNHKKHCIIC
ncbi:7877_t:CDS:2 [Dentiscutata erythropus]|uniref:7877_t:CDS:1 n=1 Tax=Dentiscutata erythropus TaxID=1348616 RepID=A0A9N8W753_9GLOM|nr:7877_t:CDS:2 [Dentiscutata erythropus]